MRSVVLSAVAASLIAAAGVRGVVTVKAEPEAPLVYSSSPADPWNRIFALLFTRTISISKTDEFEAAGPFRAPADVLPGLTPHRVSARTFRWDEEGDRAVEALYPSFLTSSGTDYILDDSRLPALLGALTDALAESVSRSPIDRALMQSDLWSAFDALDAAATRRYGPEARRGAAATLRAPVAHLIGRIALDDEAIARLPDNYRAARRVLPLPDVFAPAGQWMEVMRAAHRMHDDAADMRRASRVFVKRSAAADGTAAFLRDLGSGRASAAAQAALLMQTLLVDSRGHVVPSPLISDVQIRTPSPSGTAADVEEFELSRRRLLGDASPGGFRRFALAAPAFIPIAGNDYGFATPDHDRSGEMPPLLGTLGSRCASCHGADGARFMTFNLVSAPDRPVPSVRELRQPNDDRAREVAGAKEARADFRRLVALAFPARRP